MNKALLGLLLFFSTVGVVITFDRMIIFVFVKVYSHINVLNHHISSDAAYSSSGSQDHYGLQLVSRNNKCRL